MLVWAPSSGVLKNSLANARFNKLAPLKYVLSKCRCSSVSTAPGCSEYVVTPLSEQESEVYSILDNISFQLHCYKPTFRKYCRVYDSRVYIGRISQHSYCLGHVQYSWFHIFHSHSLDCGCLLFIHCLAIFVNKYVPKVCSSLEPLRLRRCLLRTYTPNISLKNVLIFIYCWKKHIHIRCTINNKSAILDIIR